jgi:UDP-N-acetylmuramate dehydrogenase
MSISQNIDLKQFNTFGISQTASLFARFDSVESLKALLNTAYEQLLILGGGSNLLLTKAVNALVLKNEIVGIETIFEDENLVRIKSGAGESWHNFVMHCVDHNFGGLENLSLIPGSVGASPMQNIGAYGVEIKDVFFELEALEISTQVLKTFSAVECAFGYRESIFKRALKDKFVIVSVTFQLTKANHVLKTSYGAINDELLTKNITTPTIKDISNAVIAIRQSKLPDPKVLGNAGSFFKNPVIDHVQFEVLQAKFPAIPNYPSPSGVKLAAGWLIEKAGWKGKQVGFCGVHKQQALVIVNYGGATGIEIFTLSQAIIDAVKIEFDVTLEREVNIL